MKYTKPILNFFNLGRTLLAMGTMLTLLFNSHYTLFGNEIETTSFFSEYTLFFVLFDYPIISMSIAIIILIWVISGYKPKYSGILHWYVSYSFLLSCDIIDGGDHLTSNLTLLLIPLTLIDKRHNHWGFYSIPTERVRNIIFKTAILFLNIQVSVLYLHAFIGKLKVTEWANGTAIYYWATHPYHGVNDFFRPFIRQLFSNVYMVSFATWSVLLLEFLLSAAILMKDTNRNKIVLLLLGLFFHTAIVLIHGLTSFWYATAAGLFLYLMPKKLNFSLKNIFLSWKKQFLI